MRDEFLKMAKKEDWEEGTGESAMKGKKNKRKEENGESVGGGSSIFISHLPLGSSDRKKDCCRSPLSLPSLILYSFLLLLSTFSVQSVMRGFFPPPVFL